MASLIGSILRNASLKEGDKLNILTFPTHERYQSAMANCNANFYLYRGPGIKDWNSTYAPLPANYTLLTPQDEPALDVDIDIVLSQNKFGQFPMAHFFANKYHCPLVSLEHTLPYKDWAPQQIQELNNMKGDANVFISEYSAQAWGYQLLESVIIHHGVDTEVFKPSTTKREPHLLSVVNDWINRDWCCGYKIWEQVSRERKVVVFGDTPGLSRPAKDVAELAGAYQSAQVFLNTSLISPVPTALLEAMSCGCAVVSTATCMIPEIIINGVNGFISNDPAELQSYCDILLKNPKLAEKLGKAARKTIEQKFSMDKFVQQWNGLFDYVSQNVFYKE